MDDEPYPDKCGCGWAMPKEVWPYTLMQGHVLFRCPYCDALWRVADKKNEYEQAVKVYTYDATRGPR